MLKDVTALIGTVTWPLVTVFVIVFYRGEIRQILNSAGKLLPRVKKGHAKIAGQEIDLELSELQAEALSAAEEVSALPLPTEQPAALGDANRTNPIGSRSGAADQYDSSARFLAEAKSSPKLALISLAAEIERALHEIMASSGLPEGKVSRRTPVQKSIQILRDRGLIPSHVSESVRIFWDVRNRLVHDSLDLDGSDAILRALDSGLVVLRALQAIPLERIFVEQANVPIFSDEECNVPIRDAKGLILKVVSPGGLTGRYQIFPTTGTEYRPGQQLSWEWASSNKSWDQAWYRNPRTQKTEIAWLGSCEFAGRPLGNS